MLKLLVQSLFFISFVMEAKGLQTCYAHDSYSNNITCEVEINGTVCLVCLTPRTDITASWYRANVLINYRDYFLTSQEIYSIGCHSTFKSLAVTVNGIYGMNEIYICRTHNSWHGFIIKAQVKPRLFITKDGQPVGERLELEPDRHETFYCHIYEAIAPLKLMWLINDVEYSSYLIPDKTKPSLENYNVSISVLVVESISSISCLSYGPHITNGSAVLQVNVTERNRDGRRISLTVDNVWFAFIAFMMLQVLLFIYYKRNQCFCRRSEVNQTHNNRSYDGRTQGGTISNEENTLDYMVPVDTCDNTRANSSSHRIVNDGQGVSSLQRKPFSNDVLYFDISEHQRQIVTDI